MAHPGRKEDALNPNACRVLLRPRGPLECFDLTVRFLRVRWRPLCWLAVVVLVPLWGLACVVGWFTDGHWAVAMIPIFASPFLQAPFTLMTGRLLFAEDAGVLQTQRALAARIPGLVAVTLLSVIGAGMSCGFLMPISQTALVYLPETALLERVSVGRGLSRSLRLAGGHIGLAVVGAMSWWGLSLWFGVVAEAAGQGIVAFGLQLGEPFGTVLDGQVTPFLLAGLFLAQPLHAIYRLLLYVDVRTRMEGWDLQVGLRAAGMSR